MLCRIIEDASLEDSSILLFDSLIQECNSQARGNPGEGVLGRLICNMEKAKDNIPLVLQTSVALNALMCKWFAEESPNVYYDSFNKFKTKTEVPSKLQENDSVTTAQPLYLLKQAILNALSVNIDTLSRIAFGSPDAFFPERPPVPTSILITLFELILEMVLFAWEEFDLDPDAFVKSEDSMEFGSGIVSRSRLLASPSRPQSRKKSWVSESKLSPSASNRVRDRGHDIYILCHLPLSNICYWFFHTMQHVSLYSNKVYCLLYFCLLKRRRYWNYGLDLLIYGDRTAGINGLVDELCMPYPYSGMECGVFCKLICNVVRYKQLAYTQTRRLSYSQDKMDHNLQSPGERQFPLVTYLDAHTGWACILPNLISTTVADERGIYSKKMREKISPDFLAKQSESTLYSSLASKIKSGNMFFSMLAGFAGTARTSDEDKSSASAEDAQEDAEHDVMLGSQYAIALGFQ